MTDAARRHAGRHAGPWPVRQGRRGQPHLGRRPFGAGQLRGQGRPRGRRAEEGRRRDGRRPRRPPRRRTPASTSSSSDRPAPRTPSWTIFEERPEEGHDHLVADHADPAGARVRNAGRGRCAAAAGDHRRAGARWASSARSASCRRSRDSINHVILLIGLAVGVDYALFYLRRVREERAAGRSKEAAIEAAAATSGRAVLVSGVTVMIAMAGMYFAGAADVHVVRHGHDHRGRSRDARLAHGAARRALAARRPHREGPHPRPRPPAQPGRPRRHLVAHRRPGAAAPAAVGRPGDRAAGGAGDPGDRDGHRYAEHLGARCRRTSRSCRRSTTCRTRSPQENSSLDVVIKADDVTSPESRPALAKLEHAASRAQWRCFPVTTTSSNVSPDGTVGTLYGRDRRRRNGRAVGPGARGAAQRRGRPDARFGRRGRGLRWRPDRTGHATSTTR